MKSVTRYITSDGVEHKDAHAATRHADKRRTDAIHRLASRVVNNQYRDVCEILREHTEEMREIVELQDDYNECTDLTDKLTQENS